MKDEFYGNCLLESLKAKIKNPKSVHIHMFYDVEFSIFPHFWWEENDKAFNFTSLKPRKWQVVIFKGKIIERNLKAFKAYSAAQNYHTFYKLTKIFHKKENNINIELD